MRVTMATSTARMEMVTETGIIRGLSSSWPWCASGSSIPSGIFSTPFLELGSRFGCDGLQRLARGGNRAVDIRRSVGGRYERGFKLRRRQEDAAVEHFAEEARVALGVGPL